jgi:hypothetical protein
MSNYILEKPIRLLVWNLKWKEYFSSFSKLAGSLTLKSEKLTSSSTSFNIYLLTEISKTTLYSLTSKT